MIPTSALHSTAETLMAKAAIEIPDDYLRGLRRCANTEKGDLSAFFIQALQLQRKECQVTVIQHPLFGRVEFLAADEIDEYGEICELKPIAFRDVDYEATLYYTRETLPGLTARSLEPLAALVARLDDLDKVLRTSVPDDVRESWLSDRMDPETWASEDAAAEAQAMLREAFPDTPTLSDVTAGQLAKALKLERLGFSLAPEGSGDAALTLDYRILPDEFDNYVFAAKFAADGQLISVDLES
jgi:hypothetical protein